MKVKTFVVGLIEGWTSSLAKLDERVKELGEDIKIYSLTDTMYKEKDLSENKGGSMPFSDHLARVIVYDTLDEKVEKCSDKK